VFSGVNKMFSGIFFFSDKLFLSSAGGGAVRYWKKDWKKIEKKMEQLYCKRSLYQSL